MKTPKQKPTPHNPDGVTPKQLNPPVVHYRLLDRDEITPRMPSCEIQAWSGHNGTWTQAAFSGSALSVSYRTRLTRAELAKLSKGGAK